MLILLQLIYPEYVVPIWQYWKYVILWGVADSTENVKETTYFIYFLGKTISDWAEDVAVYIITWFNKPIKSDYITLDLSFKIRYQSSTYSALSFLGNSRGIRQRRGSSCWSNCHIQTATALPLFY